MNDETEKEILDFIKRRWSDTDAHWKDGNCYYFAQILCLRFPFLQLYYLPVEGHFVAGTPSRYYDIGGRNKSWEKPVLFDELKLLDSEWSKRILRDCRD